LESSSLAVPGGTRAAAEARLWRLGTILTVEDVARGLLLMLEQAPPSESLSPEQRRRIAPLVRRAYELRQELLLTSRQAMVLESQAQILGRDVFVDLAPRQAAAITAGRDRISIGVVEERYWQALLDSIEAPPGGAGGPVGEGAGR
jgi:hypothetical protein